MSAIRGLIEAVEAGTAIGASFCIAGRPGVCWTGEDETAAYEAYHGSVDAALALMAAVTPGWPWSIDARDGFPYRAWTDERAGLRRPGFAAAADTPARALLLATLKAMEDRQ